MVKLTVRLEDQEFLALRKYAIQESRNIRNQAVLIIRKALEIEGLLLAKDSDLLNSTEDITPQAERSNEG